MKVFFSYSHKDELLRDQLEVHLAALKRQNIIESWHDRRINAGDKFAAAIDENLKEANIILLLISADFIASDYCYNVEMKNALDRHEKGLCKVIPVILRPCDWHSAPFGQLLAVPRDGKAVTTWPNLDEAFLDVTKSIRDAIQSFAQSKEQQTQLPSQAPTPNILSTLPRSSNLRIRKEFSDHDKDLFLEQAFDYIARFFEGSLLELKTRNPSLETRFSRIDTHHFTSFVYSNGKEKTRCKVWLNEGHPLKGIGYSTDISNNDNSYNERISVGNDDQRMFLQPMGIGFSFNSNIQAKFTEQGAAEHLWERFINSLQ